MSLFKLFQSKRSDIPELDPLSITYYPSSNIQLEIFTHLLDADGSRQMQKYIEKFPETHGDIVNTQVINKGNHAYVYVWYLKSKKW